MVKKRSYSGQRIDLAFIREWVIRYSLTGNRARLQSAGWPRGARRLLCLGCHHWISTRTGTAHAGIQTIEPTFRNCVRQLAEGASIRTVARNSECDKDAATR
jgi:hypothetical protein